jgi:hypothetical protein
MNARGLNFNRSAAAAAASAARRRGLHLILAACYLTVLALLAGYLLVHGLLLQRALLVAETSLGNARGLEPLSREVQGVDAAFLELLKQSSAEEIRWAPRLAQLAALLPDHAWLVKIEAGASDAGLGDIKRRRLLANVSATVRADEDKILVPMRFVQALQQDSLFASYSNLRFAATRTLDGTQATVVNFDVVCE